MVTSNGTIFLPDGPNGELVARATDTWTAQWTAPNGGHPIQALDNGGLQWLTWDGVSTVVQELDVAGGVVQSTPSNLVSPLVVHRDQGTLHGIDSSAGGLAMVAIGAEEEAGLWDALKGLISTPCVPGVIASDINPGGVGNPGGLGFAPSVTPYTFGFDSSFSDPSDPRFWRDYQKDAVRSGFMKWNDTSSKRALGFSFVETTTGTPDIILRKAPLGVNAQTQQKRVGGFAGTTFAANNRVLKGVIFFATDKTALLGEDGYYKVTLHELGHGLGLDHPNLSPLYPLGVPGFSPQRGGTVMNPMGTLVNPTKASEGLDDFLNFVPRTPTKCDIEAVRRAAQ